ncbi:MAG: hypothetical protein M3I19_01485 [Lancefieldella parvula]|uniref:Uncharacterized protein n=1 Tax=Lancefieldella parvula TaxID=1382 RepID=A0A9E7AH05_9ACTN|nr:MAG: hypothetical protein M3I19_01485 [Lancefieldella parvula]
MRVRMIDNITGKVVRVAKQFSKAVANAPKAVATVAKTGTVAQKVAMGIATTGLVAGGATGIVLNIPKQAPAPEQKPAITQPTKTEETKTEDTKPAEETKTEDAKPAEETKTEDAKPAEETKTEDTKSSAPAGHYESVQKSKYVEDGTYTVVTLTDDDGDPITFTTSFGTSSDAQFSTQAEAEAYLNAQHQALTQRTGRKRVIAGNTGRGFNVGETQTKGHTEYWTEQVWVSDN